MIFIPVDPTIDKLLDRYFAKRKRKIRKSIGRDVYRPIEKCRYTGNIVGPFNRAKLDTTTDKGNLYSECSECKIYHCRIRVMEEK